jgi:hypothetical protein
MSLKMCLYKITKIADGNYNRYKKRKALEKDLALFIPELLVDDERFVALKPFLTKVKVIDEDIDRAALSKKFADGRNVEVMGYGRSEDGSDFTFLHIDKASYGYETRKVRNEELSDCIVDVKRTYYCSKSKKLFDFDEDPKLRDFIHATLGGDIVNLGYYKVSKEQLLTINEWLTAHDSADVEFDGFNDECGLFYQEWY